MCVLDEHRSRSPSERILKDSMILAIVLRINSIVFLDWWQNDSYFPNDPRIAKTKTNFSFGQVKPVCVVVSRQETINDEIFFVQVRCLQKVESFASAFMQESPLGWLSSISLPTFWPDDPWGLLNMLMITRWEDFCEKRKRTVASIDGKTNLKIKKMEREKRNE